MRSGSTSKGSAWRRPHPGDGTQDAMLVSRVTKVGAAARTLLGVGLLALTGIGFVSVAGSALERELSARDPTIERLMRGLDERASARAAEPDGTTAGSGPGLRPSPSEPGTGQAGHPTFVVIATYFGINQWDFNLVSGGDFFQTKSDGRFPHMLYPELCPGTARPCPAQILIASPGPREILSPQGRAHFESRLRAALRARLADAVRHGDAAELQFVEHFMSFSQYFDSDYQDAAVEAAALYLRVLGEVLAEYDGHVDFRFHAVLSSNGTAVFARAMRLLAARGKLSPIFARIITGITMVDGRATAEDVGFLLATLPNARITIYTNQRDYPALGNFGGGIADLLAGAAERFGDAVPPELRRAMERAGPTIANFEVARGLTRSFPGRVQLFHVRPVHRREEGLGRLEFALGTLAVRIREQRLPGERRSPVKWALSGLESFLRLAQSLARNLREATERDHVGVSTRLDTSYVVFDCTGGECREPILQVAFRLRPALRTASASEGSGAAERTRRLLEMSSNLAEVRLREIFEQSRDCGELSDPLGKACTRFFPAARNDGTGGGPPPPPAPAAIPEILMPRVIRVRDPEAIARVQQFVPPKAAVVVTP